MSISEFKQKLQALEIDYGDVKITEGKTENTLIIGGLLHDKKELIAKLITHATELNNITNIEELKEYLNILENKFAKKSEGMSTFEGMSKFKGGRKSRKGKKSRKLRS